MTPKGLGELVAFSLSINDMSNVSVNNLLEKAHLLVSREQQANAQRESELKRIREGVTNNNFTGAHGSLDEGASRGGNSRRGSVAASNASLLH